MMEHDKLLVSIPHLIREINMHVLVVRVHFSSSLVNRQEYGFYTGSRLRHQTGCSRRGNRQASNVTTTVFYHLLIHFRGSLS